MTKLKEHFYIVIGLIIMVAIVVRVLIQVL